MHPFYKSRLLVGGIILFCLGVGNWIIGSRKLTHYQQALHQAPSPPPSGLVLPARNLWERPPNIQERADIARAKVDFYHVVVSGGHLFMSAGALAILAVLIRLRRQR